MEENREGNGGPNPNDVLFKKLIQRELRSLNVQQENTTTAVAGAVDIVEAKGSRTVNGLETSTFTICTRIRPTLDDEISDQYGI